MKVAHYTLPEGDITSLHIMLRGWVMAETDVATGKVTTFSVDKHLAKRFLETHGTTEQVAYWFPEDPTKDILDKIFDRLDAIEKKLGEYNGPQNS